MLRRRCKSKYRTLFRYYLRRLHARVYQSCGSSRGRLEWKHVPLTKRYRGRLYVLDTSFLPCKLRWIDATSLPKPSWLVEQQAEYRLRRAVEDIFYQDPHSHLQPGSFESIHFPLPGIISYEDIEEQERGSLHAHGRFQF